MLAKIDTFTDEEFTKIVSSSTNMAEIARKLGYFSHSGDNGTRIRKRIDALNLSTEHFILGNKRPIKRNPSNIFVENSTAAQKTLRKYYFNGNYTSYTCSICGQIPEWNGKPLTLILDHINGHNHDDRLENLRWVCLNCNQQLDTTNGKNIKRLREQFKKI